MVKSGLSQDPHVSQYRLTAHLGFAFIIYAYIFGLRSICSFHRKHKRAVATIGDSGGSHFYYRNCFYHRTLRRLRRGIESRPRLQHLPLMNGQFIPDGLASLDPWWRNLFENVTTVQFDHRLLAYSLIVLIPIYLFSALKRRLSAGIRAAFHLLLILLMVQVTLGVSTLLLYVPVGLAATHQGVALALFTVVLFLSHRLRKQ